MKIVPALVTASACVAATKLPVGGAKQHASNSKITVRNAADVVYSKLGREKPSITDNSKLVKRENVVKPAVDDSYTYCQLYNYLSADCDDDQPISISGAAANVCIAVTGVNADDDLIDDYYSEMYTAELSGGIYTYYKTLYYDDSCTNEYMTLEGTFSSTCSLYQYFECFDTSAPYEDLGDGIRFDYYDTSSCGGDVVTYEWTPTDYCIAVFGFNFKYFCNGDNGGTVAMYNDDDCQDLDDKASGSLPTCSYIDDQYYYDDGLYGINTVSLYESGSCSGPEYYESGGDGDDDGCFSEFDTVTLKDNSVKLISEVQVGDEVLVMNAAGEYVFSNVVFVPHGKNNNRATFVTLTTESGRAVTGTAGHLVVANDCDKLSKDDLLSVGSIAVDQCVMTVDGAERVTALKSFDGRGVYTVVTADANGKIVVNGVAASSFAYNHAVVNAYYNIHRVLYNVLPEMVKSSPFMMFNNFMGKVANM